MPKLGAEQTAVQDPMIRYAQDVGWEYLSPTQVESLRGNLAEPFITAVLRQQLVALNPGICDLDRADEVIAALRAVPPTLEGNLRSWQYLVGQRSIFVPEQARSVPVRLLDLAHLSNNRWTVTEEWRFDTGTPTPIRPDVVFAINGIPVLIVEAKSVKKPDGIAEAIDQIRRYHREAPELMAQAQLHALTHLVKFYYGATWATSRKNLYDWREESAGQVFEALVKAFVDRERVLRVLTDYVVFTRTDDELAKVVLRPNQMRASEKVVARAADPVKTRGLVWHTQGSGKTFTMIKAAQQVLQSDRFQRPLVVMLVDRNDLETQLFQNLEAVGARATVADSKEHLQKLLATTATGLVVTTIQKFHGMPANVRLGKDVVVLVDEAHRTTGGDLGIFLLAALPGATFVGFTGTPVDRTMHGKGTFKVFGKDDKEGYLDKYSIRESIADGTTVPLHYRLAPNDMRVDRETLEREFLSLAEAQGVTDIAALNRVLEKAVVLRNMLKNPYRIAGIAEHIARDFKERVEPLGYKAFVVAVDREACVFYKTALDWHLPPEWSAVVISGSNNDEAHLKEHHIDEAREKKLRKEFRKPDGLPKILIVTEKLLTGFDAPVLYGLYLDKPMRDHVLLQAIARVNRPYEDAAGRAKKTGYVVDYVGIFEKLERALAFDSADVSGVIDGVEELQVDFEKRLVAMRDAYLGIGKGLSGDKAVEAVLEFFREEDTRKAFAKAWEALEDLYEILSPDAFLRPFMDEYEALANIVQVLRSMYGSNVVIDRSFRRKTEALVREHTVGEQPRDDAKTYTLDAKGLADRALRENGDAPKVWDLVRRIRDDAEKEGTSNPVLRSIGERAEQVVKDFEDRQTTTQDMLTKIAQLRHEQEEARAAALKSGLGAQGFNVLWTFTQQKVPKADEIAQVVDAAVTEHPHWQSNEDLAREFRMSLYLTLDDLTDDVPGMVERIFKVLGR
ncbi:MAG: HsdR family type I site-specific deoxyribonuclease [Deltaproteobacteria bacterium]|nr:HsdR family type I site-specific deoxyribonuclease [Deltaproteobacteria bacterium]